MEVSNYVRRYKLMLEKLFERKIVINEYQQETLLKFLVDGSGNSPGKQILNAPAFSDVVLNYFDKVHNADTSLKVFLIVTVENLFKHEVQLKKMQEFHTLACKCVLDNLNSNPPHNLHLACIKLATSQLIHGSGLDLIIEHKVWEHILYPNIHHKPKHISKAAYEFMAKLVWRVNEHNIEPALLEILGYTVKPIQSIGYFELPVLDNETDAAICDKIYPHLSALLFIMNEPIINVMEYEHVFRVMILLKDHFLLDHAIYEIFIGTRNGYLVKLLNLCLFLYCFQLHLHLLYSQKIDEFCNKMSAYHRNYVVQSVKKRDAFAVIDYAIQSTIILSKFKKAHENFNLPLTFERNGQTIEFPVQIVTHLLVPILGYTTFERIKALQRDEIEQFAMKMGKTVTDFIYSSCYLYGTLLDDGGETFKKKIVTHTLKELMCLTGHINESQAGPLFQSLYYLLEKFIIRDDTGGIVVNENAPDPDDLRILTHLLDAMKMLLKEHNISWYENLEVVNIQAVLLNLIKQNFLTTKHMVQILDIINICIKKFLSPNMSLLVENTGPQDSTLNTIGDVMKLYIQHEDWEVRDSAFSLLHSCTKISFIKYIPLQRQIIDNQLIILAAKAALCDPDFYSQCSALKCLAAATKIDSIWQETLVDNENLYLHLVYLLRNHNEAMVRKEVANVLTAVFANQKVTPCFQKTLHEVMLLSSLDDLHWEVQLAALNFWKTAIHKHLTYRGMLDGKFPPVTFSKEKRKIIVLNNTEIQRQLTGIMNYLSNIGCLTALLECMNEIHSVNVMIQAYNIAKELIEMLDKYNFVRFIDNIEPRLTEHFEIAQIIKEEKTYLDPNSATNEEERDRVIDNILSTNQSELIINLHDSYNKMKSEEMDIDTGYCPRRVLVVPDKFLDNFRNSDYSVLIENRKRCNADGVCTLDRLFDEILDLEVIN